MNVIKAAFIGCNWGGTVAAAWMKEETLRKVEPEWTAAYDLFQKQVDWEDYMSRQRVGVQNDRGNLIGDPFYEYVMPCNRTPEECGAFRARMAQEGNLPNLKETKHKHQWRQLPRNGKRLRVWFC